MLTHPRRRVRPILLTLSIAWLRCSGSPTQSTPDLSASDLGAAGGMVAACPTTGKGAISAPAACWTFTPAQAGASAAGANATDAEYALEPAGTAQNALVLYINSSLSSPAMQIADPQKNFYNAAAQAGYHVLSVAYRSTSVVGSLCAGQPACFGPTRRTLVLGSFSTGASSTVADIRADEGIVQRAEAALRLLAAAKPGGGWAQYLTNLSDPDVTKHITWGSVIASGHSQGGGHAAYLGSLFPLRRVVQLSSTCDATAGTPAPWTAAANPWATPPATVFIGFAAPTVFTGNMPTGGDTTCPYHHAIWQNLGMDTSRMLDDAATCGVSGDTHTASILCVDNFPRWPTLLK
jgi:hypothetical protein